MVSFAFSMLSVLDRTWNKRKPLPSLSFHCPSKTDNNHHNMCLIYFMIIETVGEHEAGNTGHQYLGTGIQLRAFIAVLGKLN